MSPKLLLFDSHPVQYRVPIWQAIEREHPGMLCVVYATDCSVRGHMDKGFGKNVTWDDGMMNGYTYEILNSVNGEPLSGWNSLHGRGVAEVIKRVKPTAILITGLNYRYDVSVLIWANILGVPVWLRAETQDYASDRTPLKGLIRSLIYRFLYRLITRFFYIGELNRAHYLSHGVKEHRLSPARYATVDRFKALTLSEKSTMRKEARLKAGFGPNQLVIGFSGKFIPKKHPDILYAMVKHLPAEIRSQLGFYFLGSGAMQDHLVDLADQASKEYGIFSYFAGFANQSELASHYLAMDILVLPSRKQGETWGLVVNEALQAGCSCIVSDAVGSNADFKKLDRFRVFKEEDSQELASAVTELSEFTREFEWAAEGLRCYSIDDTATALIRSLNGN